MPDRRPKPSEPARMPRKPSHRRKHLTVICLATDCISLVEPNMKSRDKSGSDADAVCLVPRESNGFCTRSEVTECMEDWRSVELVCLLCVLGALWRFCLVLLGAESTLSKADPCPACASMPRMKRLFSTDALGTRLCLKAVVSTWAGLSDPMSADFTFLTTCVITICLSAR